MGLDNLPADNEFISVDDDFGANKNYYLANSHQFNGNAFFNYRFDHAGFNYLNNNFSTNPSAGRYLNNSTWNGWNAAMSNQKTTFHHYLNLQY